MVAIGHTLKHGIERRRRQPLHSPATFPAETAWCNLCEAGRIGYTPLWGQWHTSPANCVVQGEQIGPVLIRPDKSPFYLPSSRQDAHPVQPNANVRITANKLRITAIQLNDIGEYRCTSRNREGSISASSKIIIAGPAVITLPPRNLTKLEGDPAEFPCEAKALPSNVTHRWFHNGVDITHLSFLDNRYVVRQGMLIIKPTSAEDSGRYTCEVSNGIGIPETAEAHLNVECELWRRARGHTLYTLIRTSPVRDMLHRYLGVHFSILVGLFVFKI